MGIAIHYGRVYLARFIADEETVQTTVIGRNVNLAGRLVLRGQEGPGRGRGRTPERRRARRPEFQVTVDAARHAVQRGHRHQPGHARAAGGPPARWCTPRRRRQLDGVLRRADRPAHPDPLRGRRQVQGRCAPASPCTPWSSRADARAPRGHGAPGRRRDACRGADPGPSRGGHHADPLRGHRPGLLPLEELGPRLGAAEAPRA